MIKYLAILVLGAAIVGCASDPAPESISPEKAQAAQSKFETGSQGADSQAGGAAPSNTGAPASGSGSEGAPVSEDRKSVV